MTSFKKENLTNVYGTFVNKSRFCNNVVVTRTVLLPKLFLKSDFKEWGDFVFKSSTETVTMFLCKSKKADTGKEYIYLKGTYTLSESASEAVMATRFKSKRFDLVKEVARHIHETLTGIAVKIYEQDIYPKVLKNRLLKAKTSIYVD